jgi:tetratricopeptide (TPR) repeat protein
MPDGATKANEAIALARQSIRANPQSAMLPLEIGKIFDSMVQFYLRDQATLLYELYERANALAREDRMRIRARLNLGHAHRKYGRCEDAVKWYREVLLIDSANEVARRELSRLSCGT